jgi:hypothetical protein
MVAVKKSQGNFRDYLATTVPDMPQRCKASIETCTAQATLTVVLASRRDLSVITAELAVRQTICKSLQPAKSFGGESAIEAAMDRSTKLAKGTAHR